MNNQTDTNQADSGILDDFAAVSLRSGTTYFAHGYRFDRTASVTVHGERLIKFFEDETVDVDVVEGDETVVEERPRFKVERGVKGGPITNAQATADTEEQKPKPVRRRRPVEA